MAYNVRHIQRVLLLHNETETLFSQRKCYSQVFLFGVDVYETWPRGYKTFFVLNSVEHEILNHRKYEYIKKFSIL